MDDGEVWARTQINEVKEHIPFCTKPEWGYWWRPYCTLWIIPRLKPLYGDPTLGAIPIHPLEHVRTTSSHP
jgi:hypothetical protein